MAATDRLYEELESCGHVALQGLAKGCRLRILIRPIMTSILINIRRLEAITKRVYYSNNWEEIDSHIENEAQRVRHLNHHLKAAVIQIEKHYIAQMASVSRHAEWREEDHEHEYAEHDFLNNSLEVLLVSGVSVQRRQQRNALIHSIGLCKKVHEVRKEWPPERYVAQRREVLLLRMLPRHMICSHISCHILMQS